MPDDLATLPINVRACRTVVAALEMQSFACRTPAAALEIASVFRRDFMQFRRDTSKPKYPRLQCRNLDPRASTAATGMDRVWKVGRVLSPHSFICITNSAN